MIPRALLLLLFATPTYADAVGDVRAALGRFPARETVRAVYELQQSVNTEGKFDNEKYSGKVAVELEGSANGVRLTLPRPLIEQIVREQQIRDRNPKQNTPTASALREVDPLSTADALDFAPTLLRLIDGAKLLSDAAGTWQGRPARVLVLRVPDRLDDEDAGRMKISENKLTLWLGADHVPLAAEHQFAAKFSFLIFKGEAREKKSWHLARVSDRLVRTRYEFTQSSSGMGQKGSESIVATVTLR